MKLSHSLLKSAALTAVLAAYSTGPAQARIIGFYLENTDSKPVTVTVHARHCYEPSSKGAGGKQKVLQPGEVYAWEVARSQTSNCDGHNGNFALSFSPGAVSEGEVRNDVFFAYDNALSMWVDERALPNHYPGTLSRTAYGVFRYKTVKSRDPIVGKAVGSWEHAGGGSLTLSKTVEKSLDLGEVSESSWSRSVSRDVAVSIEAGVEFGAGSASTTVSMGMGTTSEEAASIAKSKSKGYKDTCQLELDFKTYAVSHAWQWVVTTTVDNDAVTISTCQITCSVDFKKPTYDAYHVPYKSCAGGVAGTRWTYLVGDMRYHIDFNRDYTVGFTNNYWVGVTWRSLGGGKLELTGADGTLMYLAVKGDGTLTGENWAEKTPVTGNLIGPLS